VSAVLRYDVRQAVLHLVLILVNVLCFWVYFEQYVRRRPWWDELREIFRVVALSLLLASAALFYTNLDAGRGLTLWTWGSAFVLLPLGRIAARQVLDGFGLWRRPAYIVGTGRNAQEAYLAVRAESYMGYSIIGFICPSVNSEESPASMKIKDCQLPIFPLFSRPHWASELRHVELIVAMENLSEPHAQRMLQQLMRVNDSVHIIPSIRGLPLFGAKLSHFFSHEVLFLTVRNNLSRRGYLIVKRTFDVVASLLLIIGLSPLMLWIAYRIWKEDGGPVIFSQPRVGYGKDSAFKFLKFRSMVRNADDVLQGWQKSNSPEWQQYVAQNFKLPEDPRILKIGRFIRGNSLDELPQLFNVLKGEMSLVGPRPLLERELEVYGDNIGLYQQARPGITGLWQVSGRSQTTFAERVALDQWYVQNWSLWYDLAILLKTVKVVFRREGAY
jgi:Undecaprenyl-phosphate galactose phosphotransferase WbaP